MSIKKQNLQIKWETRINRAKKVNETWKKKFRVDMLKDFFDGQQNIDGFPIDEWITINKFYTTLKSQLPTLYDVDPYFYVKLRRAYTADPDELQILEAKAEARSAFLNYLKSELCFKQKVRLAVQDSHFQYGVIKVHYCYDKIENPEGGQPIMDEEGTLLYGTDGNPILSPDYVPANEAYKLTRVHPDDFIWDEDASTTSDTWSWVAQRIRLNLNDAMKDQRYKKAALRRLRDRDGNKGQDERDREMRKKGEVNLIDPLTGEREPDPDPVFTAWEIYNIKDRTWITIAEDGEIPITDEEPYPVWMEDHPFAILIFTMRDDSPYPIPPLSPGVEPQIEYNRARSSIQTHRKRFNRKYEVDVTSLEDESELSKLESGDDGTMIKVRQRGAIAAIQDAPLDSMRYAELNYLRQELTETLGGVTASGAPSGIADAESATQAGIMDKRLDIKEGDARAIVMEFVIDIARKLDKMVQYNITGDQMVKVTGINGDEGLFLVKETDYDAIHGEYEYKINIGSTVPRLPQLERASFLGFVSFLGNAPQFLQSKRLLKKIAEMHHVDDDAMINEMYEIGRRMMAQTTGAGSPPNVSGSQAGVSESKPGSAVMGQNNGYQSLNRPMGGNEQMYNG